jgi:hypothetical protein
MFTSCMVLKLFVLSKVMPVAEPAVPYRIPDESGSYIDPEPKLILKFLKVLFCDPLTGMPFKTELATRIPMLNFFARWWYY